MKKCIFSFVPSQMRPLLAGCRNRDLRRHVCQPLTRGHFGLVHAEDLQRSVHETQWHRIQKGNDHFREDSLSISFHGVAWSRCSAACPPFGLICEKFGSCQCPRRRTYCRTLQVLFSWWLYLLTLCTLDNFDKWIPFFLKILWWKASTAFSIEICSSPVDIIYELYFTLLSF